MGTGRISQCEAARLDAQMVVPPQQRPDLRLGLSLAYCASFG